MEFTMQVHRVGAMAFLFVVCACFVAFSVQAAPVAVIKDLNIDAPGSVGLESGKSKTFTVSFSGLGIDKIGVTASGSGLSAKITGANWQPYPNKCTAKITVAADNFQGGSVMFALVNSSWGVIKSQTIAIPVSTIDQSPSTSTRASTSTQSNTSSSRFDIDDEIIK